MKSVRLPARPILRRCVLYTAAFSLLAHGYRFLTMAFSGDASMIFQSQEREYQITLGRFLQPVYWQIRGAITAPLTVGLFATAALVLSAILVVALLDLTDRPSIALVCGMLATNETLSVSFASYLPWADVYAIALLFAMLGVFVGARLRYGYLLSPVFYCLSLALYQSYIQTAAALMIVLLILRLLRGESAGKIWLEGVKGCLSLLAGLVLYWAVLKLVLFLTGLETTYDYNGIRGVGQMSPSMIPSLLLSTYRYPLAFFLRPADSAVIPPALTLPLLALSLAAVLVRIRRMTLSAGLTLLLLILLMPLGMNFVAFISKGIVHPLMVYSFFFLYILCFALWSFSESAPSKALPFCLRRVGRCACAFIGAAMLCVNIVIANQLYLRRDLEFYSTTSAATRILERADAVEGYIPGETPVVIIGYLPSSPIGFVRPGFEALSNLQGMSYTYAASYEAANDWYFQMILGYPLNLVSNEERRAYTDSGIAEDMPLFPEEGCMQMIDGKLFIHLS